MNADAQRRLPMLPGVPKTRGDCVGTSRPCPHVMCRHHLAVEGATAHHDTCSLDVADRGGVTLGVVAGIFSSVSRERARQLEEQALVKAIGAAVRMGLRRSDALGFAHGRNVHDEAAIDVGGEHIQAQWRRDGKIKRAKVRAAQ